MPNDVIYSIIRQLLVMEEANNELGMEVAGLKNELKNLKNLILKASGLIPVLFILVFGFQWYELKSSIAKVLDTEAVRQATVQINAARDTATSMTAQINQLYLELPWKLVQVIDAPSDDRGRLFTFDASIVDQIVGNQQWHDQTFLIINSRTSQIAPAIFWRKDDEIPKGTGRWESGDGPNQWRKDDSFIIVHAPNNSN